MQADIMHIYRSKLAGDDDHYEGAIYVDDVDGSFESIRISKTSVQAARTFCSRHNLHLIVSTT